jgi:hypothetical protein
MNVRQVKAEDHNVINNWWIEWGYKLSPSLDMLPNNGLDGFVCEKNEKIICAGFVYTTNSSIAVLEWFISDPKYKNIDLHDAIEKIALECFKMAKDNGAKVIITNSNKRGILKAASNLGCSIEEGYSIITKKI